MKSHVSAGRPGSGDVNGFGHLTRFAAYFVALNADQPKPESTARDTPMRGCMEQR